MTEQNKNSGSSSRATALVAGRFFLYGLFLFIAVYLGVTYRNARIQHNRLERQYESYHRRLQEMRRSNRVLAEKNRRLRQDPEAIEYLLRKEYHLLEPDEYRIVEDR